MGRREGIREGGREENRGKFGRLLITATEASVQERGLSFGQSARRCWRCFLWLGVAVGVAWCEVGEVGEAGLGLFTWQVGGGGCRGDACVGKCQSGTCCR